MLERITITIKKDLLNKIDSIIDKKEIKNRSHAIEKLVEKNFNLNTVLIMAGSENSPSMAVFNGKTMLENQIEMLKENGIKNIIVSINKKDKKTQEYFSDGSDFGISINYILEDSPLGTAGAVALMKDGDFGVLNVDTLINPSIKDMYNFHKSIDSTATLLVTAVKDPKQFGSVRINGNKVVEFLEKPKTKDPSLLINAGFCIFNNSVLKYTNNKKQMIQDLFNSLIKDEKLYAFMYDKEMKDILKN